MLRKKRVSERVRIREGEREREWECEREKGKQGEIEREEGGERGRQSSRVRELSTPGFKSKQFPYLIYLAFLYLPPPPFKPFV